MLCDHRIDIYQILTRKNFHSSDEKSWQKVFDHVKCEVVIFEDNRRRSHNTNDWLKLNINTAGCRSRSLRKEDPWLDSRVWDCWCLLPENPMLRRKCYSTLSGFLWWIYLNPFMILMKINNLHVLVLKISLGHKISTEVSNHSLSTLKTLKIRRKIDA